MVMCALVHENRLTHEHSHAHTSANSFSRSNQYKCDPPKLTDELENVCVASKPPFLVFWHTICCRYGADLLAVYQGGIAFPTSHGIDLNYSCVSFTLAHSGLENSMVNGACSCEANDCVARVCWFVCCAMEKLLWEFCFSLLWTLWSLKVNQLCASLFTSRAVGCVAVWHIRRWTNHDAILHKCHEMHRSTLMPELRWSESISALRHHFEQFLFAILNGAGDKHIFSYSMEWWTIDSWNVPRIHVPSDDSRAAGAFHEMQKLHLKEKEKEQDWRTCFFIFWANWNLS